MTPLRTTLRRLIGLHYDHVGHLLNELEKGAKLESWIEAWRRECAAVKPILAAVLGERVRETRHIERKPHRRTRP